METSEDPQLHMIWNPANSCGRPDLPNNYSLEVAETSDGSSIIQLMAHGDFDPWSDEKLKYNLNRIIPSGLFFVNYDGRPIATAMALHNYSNSDPFTGDLGWLVCHKDHRGKRIGLALTRAVTQRFLVAGYDRIQLHTEHYRLPAIKGYLAAGYLPNLTTPEIAELWRDVCAKLAWEYTPDVWKFWGQGSSGDSIVN